MQIMPAVVSPTGSLSRPGRRALRRRACLPVRDGVANTDTSWLTAPCRKQGPFQRWATSAVSHVGDPSSPGNAAGLRRSCRLWFRPRASRWFDCDRAGALPPARLFGRPEAAGHPFASQRRRTGVRLLFGPFITIGHDAQARTVAPLRCNCLCPPPPSH
jgi:hypothetical protein